MTIAILPARLANQIAAGEVVERPASVVKELVENSLDAGATTVKIDIEKGGAKRICISDDGRGIPKDELTLALSRHATSKIKDLQDLEGINSLGFRGEALASISSVSRLVLTSKPKDQHAAWQAIAEGRDMTVNVQPAAHPDGTSIDVKDLFFNTPARRKFLRTEKTEFSHIEEVIKRIALACFNVTFILNHNGKMVKHFRAAHNAQQRTKRVGQICGQRFIDHAIEVSCQHDDIEFSGWLAQPEYFRTQNDLCYSYVNGRMMRDKLINHAIRQAYENRLPPETYPAFVLFLTVNVKEVDVNVHPAKHEVRFHQSRYVHDFIFSVCNKAITEQLDFGGAAEHQLASPTSHDQSAPLIHGDSAQTPQTYIKPLQYNQQISESAARSYTPHHSRSYSEPRPSQEAINAYQALLSPSSETHVQPVYQESCHQVEPQHSQSSIIQIVNHAFAVMLVEQSLRLVSLSKIEQLILGEELAEIWAKGLISQPLLIPLKLTVSVEQHTFISEHADLLNQYGIQFTVIDKTHIQIRQFPALLRDNDVTASFTELVDMLREIPVDGTKSDNQQLNCLTKLMATKQFEQADADRLLVKTKDKFSSNYNKQLLLNSAAIDLTSAITQLS